MEGSKKRRKGSVGHGAGHDPVKLADPTTQEKDESIRAFRSAIGKTEKALAGMVKKGVSTTLIRKRLEALTIGSAVLEEAWHQTVHSYSEAELTQAADILERLLPSIEAIRARPGLGKAQQTLTERRLRALKLAIELIRQRI